MREGRLRPTPRKVAPSGQSQPCPTSGRGRHRHLTGLDVEHRRSLVGDRAAHRAGCRVRGAQFRLPTSLARPIGVVAGSTSTPASASGPTWPACTLSAVSSLTGSGQASLRRTQRAQPSLGTVQPLVRRDTGPGGCQACSGQLCGGNGRLEPRRLRRACRLVATGHGPWGILGA